MISTIFNLLVNALLSPTVYFCTGYIGGWLLSFVFGSKIAEVINLVFNTTTFDAGMIPWIAGVIAAIGWLFTCSDVNKNDK